MTPTSSNQDPSFDPDTLVFGRFGSHTFKEIRFVKPGEWVWARNVVTGEQSLKRVVVCFKSVAPLFKVYYIDADGEVDLPVLTTTNQLFLVASAGWTAARALQPGMVIRSNDGFVTVSDAYEAEVDSEVFSIGVEDFHSHFVGPGALLVHDKSPQNSVPDETSWDGKSGL